MSTFSIFTFFGGASSGFVIFYRICFEGYYILSTLEKPIKAQVLRRPVFFPFNLFPIFSGTRWNISKKDYLRGVNLWCCAGQTNVRGWPHPKFWKNTALPKISLIVVKKPIKIDFFYKFLKIICYFLEQICSSSSSIYFQHSINNQFEQKWITIKFSL